MTAPLDYAAKYRAALLDNARLAEENETLRRQKLDGEHAIEDVQRHNVLHANIAALAGEATRWNAWRQILRIHQLLEAKP